LLDVAPSATVVAEEAVELRWGGSDALLPDGGELDVQLPCSGGKTTARRPVSDENAGEDLSKK
jgi:hypothetical protein